MGWPVVTVASGGMPVTDVTATTGRGTPVTEAVNTFGRAVTKVASGGMAVAYEALVVWPPPVVPALPVTWDPATVTAVTLSGGNLVATNTGTTSADQGARVASSGGKTAGKWYFEMICTTTGPGLNSGAGIGTTASTYTGMGNLGGVTGDVLYFHNNVYSNNSTLMTFGGGGFFGGNVMGIAADLDNRKIWFRKSPNTVGPFGNWNDSGTANPVTNTGGLTVPAGTMVPFVTFGGSSGTSGIVFTANFGASAFTGAAPAGFTSGWTA